MLVDPAVNVVFQRMKAQLVDYKEKLEQAQNDLSAWKFTPDRSAGLKLHPLVSGNWLLTDNSSHMYCTGGSSPTRKLTGSPVVVHCTITCCMAELESVCIVCKLYSVCVCILNTGTCMYMDVSWTEGKLSAKEDLGELL